MKILVIDVAAEHGGALSILKQFVKKFREDTENEYIVYVSKPEFPDSENVKFVRVPWVKRSNLHRMYFDSVYVKKLLREHRPDRLFSLQNKGFKSGKTEQDVYFHNALFICEKRFSYKESRKLWVYQNVISRMTKKSLKRANRIYVQAEWIKNALAREWKIDSDKICVDRPGVAEIFLQPAESSKEDGKCNLFYPANYSVYKNHRTLLAACVELWEEKGRDAFSLTLSGSMESIPESLRKTVENKGYPISFVGRLSPEEMKAEYERSVLVFPSYIETVGLPLLEARALNRPIIASNCEYAHETVGEYDRVTYFAPFDVEALKKAICEKI